MRYLLTGKEMKCWEKQMMKKYKVPSILLMERAACAVVKEIFSGKYDLHKVLIVCGTGNNGGDGLAVARMLKIRGINVQAVLVGKMENLSGDAALQMEMYQAVSGNLVTGPNCEEYTVIVDALFGIGCNRTVTGEKAAMIQKINAAVVPVVSIDVPSGISSETGEVCGTAVKADTTVTFFTKKLGMVRYPGRSYCGKVIVEDLELPFEKTSDCNMITYAEEDFECLPQRNQDSHKGTYGRVLVIAGSPVVGGAAYFSAAAAYKTGCGLVKLYTPEENRTAMQALLPEALLEIYDRKNLSIEQLTDAVDWAGVIVIGPGLGTDETAEKILEQVLLKSKVPLVVDADAINLLAKKRELLWKLSQEAVLTPHIMEMARLMGVSKEDVKADALEICRKFTEEYPITLVLKDSATLVAKKQELLYVNSSGNCGMATGGSGDVLAGMIGGLIAQGMKICEASRLGVYLHGKAGDAAAEKKGVYSMTASDLLDSIAEVTKK